MGLKNLYLKAAKAIKNLAEKSSPQWGVLLIDIFLAALAFILAYLIRFNFVFDFGHFHILPQLLIVLVLALISFLITGSYKGVIRHTGLHDVILVTKSATIFTLFLFILIFFSRKYEVLKPLNMPLSVVGISFFALTFLLIGARILYKAFIQKIRTQLRTPKKILIHGAHSGKAVFDAILSDADSGLKVEALVDERYEYVNKYLNSKPIFHPTKISKDLIDKYQIEEVIISKPEASSLELLNIAQKYLDLGLKVKTVPYINQWINNESINLNQIKELNIEELLSRSPIKIDNPVIKNDIHNKVVMITGAAGSIGSEIATQVILYKPKQLILIDQAESALYDIQQDFLRKSYDNFIAIVADIRDKNIMAEYFSTYKPEVIYHAAAYKHVPLMEENPYEAIKVNVFGSKNLMDLAVANNVHKFVMISTDKAVNPTNVMGATKRAAEIYATCLQAHISTTKFIITRFGNVLGSNGSVIKLFQKQLKQGGPLTVTHKKITRFFMTIPEACNLVLEAGTMGDGGEIFVFDMGEPVRIYDLAVKMIQLSGYHYPEDIEIKITGLRSGEKLYEEVLGNDEGDLPTYHEKVKIAALKEVDCQEFLTKLKDLEHYKKMSNFEIVKILKEMIPEFISNNSIYSKLDQN